MVPERSGHGFGRESETDCGGRQGGLILEGMSLRGLRRRILVFLPRSLFKPSLENPFFFLSAGELEMVRCRASLE